MSDASEPVKPAVPVKQETVEEMLARLKLTRYKILCNCGCGKHVAWLDLSTSLSAEELATKLVAANKSYTHGDCAKKQRETKGV